jgi:hypothetical protein
MERRLNVIQGVIISALLTIISVAVITVAADLTVSLKTWLKDTFTHHWIGKGVLAAGLFVLLTLFLSVIPRKIDWPQISRAINWLILSTILSGIAIALFFIWETFWK